MSSLPAEATRTFGRTPGLQLPAAACDLVIRQVDDGHQVTRAAVRAHPDRALLAVPVMNEVTQPV